DQLRREPLHPPVEGHVVDLDAPLGQQFLQVSVGQPEPRTSGTSGPPARSPPPGTGSPRNPRAGPRLDDGDDEISSCQCADQTRLSVHATVPPWVPALAWAATECLTVPQREALSAVSPWLARHPDRPAPLAHRER